MNPDLKSIPTAAQAKALRVLDREPVKMHGWMTNTLNALYVRGWINMDADGTLHITNGGVVALARYRSKQRRRRCE